MTYQVDYVDSGNWGTGRQSLGKGMSLEVAFDLVATETARSYISDGLFLDNAVDMAYQVSIDSTHTEKSK